MRQDYSLIIIGAGLQGVSFFLNLPPKLRERTLMLDKNAQPLQNFYTLASNVGMKYLRSPASHCLIEPLISLFSFAKKIKAMNHFQGKYYTPSLSLFRKYLSELLEKTKLKKHYFQSTVKRLQYAENCWRVHTEHGEFQSKNCILALGMGSITLPKNLNISIATSMHSRDLQSKHILHPLFEYPTIEDKNIAVVGGGMSGSQCALHLLEQSKKKKSNTQVTLITSKPDSVHFFDSHPGYIGPKYRPSFLQEKNYNKRTDIIKQSKNKGSINPFVQKQLQEAEENQMFQIKQAYVNRIKITESSYGLDFPDAPTENYDEVIFATGFQEKAPFNLSLVQNLAEEYGLERFKDYWPIPNQRLAWHSGLYLSGALAELEIGPPARNIIGAHLCHRIFSQFWEGWI